MRMKRLLMLVSLLLVSLVAGCASQRGRQAVPIDSTAFERQSMQRQQFVEERLQALSERVTQSEKSQAEVRHEFAKVIDSNEELRVEIQRLQGAVQEISYQLQHNT